MRRNDLTATAPREKTHSLRWDLFKRFAAFFQGNWGALLLILLLTALTGSLASLFPILFRQIEDGFRNHNASLLLEGFGLFAGYYLAQAGISLAVGYLQAGADAKIQKRVLLDFYDHIHQLPIPFLDTLQGKGEIYQRLSDLLGLQYTLTGLMLSGARNFLLVGIYLSILTFFSPVISIIVFSFFSLYLFCIRWGNSLLQEKSRRRLEAGTRLTGYLFDTLNGLLTIRASAAARQVHDDAEELVESQNAAQYDLSLLNAQLAFWNSLFTQITLLTIISYMGYSVFRGVQTFSALLATYAIAGSTLGPLQSLTDAFQRLRSANVALVRTFQILDSPAEGPVIGLKRAMPIVKGEIEFRDVVFGYRADQPVLKDVSFRIPAGKTTAIVGRSGMGKTTIMKLLLAFYQPESGSIRVDNVDLTTVDPTSWREQIGVVLQFDQFFKGTFRKNLQFGKRTVLSDGELIQSLKDAQLWDFVATLPEQLDTEVDNEKLSGGQRQRLVLARAFVRNPKVLILDEPVSSLDPTSEALIQKSLQELTKDKTSIIIAHRHSTIRHADQILVLDDGRIAEQGTHEELLTRRGAYYALYEDASWL